MDISGTKIALLVHNYFEQSEFEEPLNAFRSAGADVTVISATNSTKLQSLIHADKGDRFEADLLLKNANPDDYDALVIPGGVVNADALRADETAQEWVDTFLDDDRPIAAICHAPWLLVSADLVDGRRLTSYHTIQDDIRNAGGEWVDLPLVIDDNLITSRKPDDLMLFNDAVINMLEEQLAAKTTHHSRRL
jgi:protease I